MNQDTSNLISKEMLKEIPKEILEEEMQHDDSEKAETVKSAGPMRLEIDVADKFFVFFFVLIGYAFWKVLTSIVDFGRNIAFFTVFYVAAILVYCYWKKLKLTKEMWFWTGIVLAIGVPYMFWSAIEIQFLVLVVTAGYWTYMVTGSLIGGKTSEWTVPDVWNAMVQMPFTNFEKQIRVIFHTIPRCSSRKNILAVLLGVVMAIPVLMFAVPLLMQADRGFDEFISSMSWNLNVEWGYRTLEMIITLLISSYLYGLLYGSSHHRIDVVKQKNSILDMVKNIRVIPNLAVNTAVTIVNALYILFITVQSRYFFSAFAESVRKNILMRNMQGRDFLNCVRLQR